MSRHVKMVELYNNGVAYEVIVVNHNPETGDLFFIRTQDLDQIDYERMDRILRKREADRMPLWDLLDSITLKNGVNALKYFHQLVQVRTASGEIIKPDMRRRGARKVRPALNTESSTISLQKTVETENSAEVQAPPAPVKQGKRAPKADKE